MPNDPRPRFRVFQAIETKTEGAFAWLRVGTAYQNPDGTIDAYFKVMVLGARFRLRRLRSDERDDVEEEPVTELLS